ncbi:TetR/AcrR family transcriptional regulator [Amycolatopsis sp.]|uniref:TetR/AcrR family transcriptional regulator n=1 Tax=Amycolatopsis sp. TaxID=37632 RepID=UPI002615E2CB|nr:TetR/AcrR family transcriptional regulator [Amycolatopsis sp.]
MPYRRTPAVQARLDAQRVVIFEAAVDSLATHGYAGCSVAAVATRAGIATGSVYQHFPSKTGLVVELFRSVVAFEVAAVEEASTQSEDPVKRIVAVLETFASRALKAPRLAYALLAEPVDAPIEAERLVFRRAFIDVVASRIEEAIEVGALPPQDAELSAAALVGATAEVLIGPLTAESADASVLEKLSLFTVRALGGSLVRNA